MRNSSLVKSSCAEDDRGLSLTPKLRASIFYGTIGAVEEHSQGIEAVPIRSRGALGRDYVGMSSDKAGGKPARRKPKGSRGRLIRPGLVDPKERPDRRI